MRSEEGGESKSLGGLRAPKAGPVEAGHNLPVLARALDAVGHRQSCDRPVCGVEARQHARSHHRFQHWSRAVMYQNPLRLQRREAFERRQNAALALGAALNWRQKV